MSSILHCGDGHLTISTTNLRKSVKFYTQVLGFKITKKIDEPAWCEISVNQIHIGLAEVQSVIPSQTSLTILVSDLDAAITGLKSHKIDHSAISEVPNFARLVTFDDPDGNPIMFRQNI